MISSYLEYIKVVEQKMETNLVAEYASDDLAPMFSRIEPIFRHYCPIVSKFRLVELDLIKYLDQLDFEESDVSVFQDRFLMLEQLNNYLLELTTKANELSAQSTVADFVDSIFSQTSFATLSARQDEVLGQINRLYESSRQKPPKGCLGIVILIIFSLFALSFIIL